MTELQEFMNEMNQWKGGISADVKHVREKIDKMEETREESSRNHWGELRKMTDSIADQKVAHATLKGEVKAVKAVTGSQNKKVGMISASVIGVIEAIKITWEHFTK